MVRRLEISAPTRLMLVDDEGGRGLSLGVATDRRIWCAIEPRAEGIRIESKDVPQVLEGERLLGLPSDGDLGSVVRVLEALGIESRVLIQVRLRASAKLFAPLSALAVALAVGVRRLSGRTGEVGSSDSDILSAVGAVGGTPLDAGLALRGGLAFQLDLAAVTAASIDPARIEECLSLVVLPDDDGEPDRPSATTAPAVAGDGLLEALADNRPGRATEALAALWEELPSVRPGGAAAEVIELIRASEGAARRCGTTAVLAWTEPGPRGQGVREGVVAALARQGLRLLPVRVDLRGLEAEEASIRV